jgi:membrane-bound metal-dependent hydrolase YbcI (DUF457 family)
VTPVSDLLTHVLAGYVLATLASWRIDWLRPRHVPLAMLGSALPDAAKVHLVAGGVRTTVAGVEVSWLALQTVGGALSLAAIGVLLVPRRERRPVSAVLVGGVLVHVALDYFVIRAGGRAPPSLYPLSWVQLPAGNLYLSSDVWPALVALAVATTVWVLDRRRDTSGSTA